MSKKEKKSAEKKRRKEKPAKKAEKREKKKSGEKKSKAKLPKVEKQRIKNLTKRIKGQTVFPPIIIVVSAAAALMLMTWLIRDVLGVEHIYAAASFELIGVVVVLVGFLIPFNIVLYRRRSKEVITLSQAIRRVAGGDYKSRIPTEKKRGITPIYEDFNKMCDELESVQILRNDFINNYSHEFKTPIASINGFAELLMEKKDLSEEDKRMYLEIIADESSRLSKFASDTTLLSRLSSQQIVTDLETYDLSEQLRQCTIILSPKWLEKEQEFTAELAPVYFHGNKEMMQHLWLNLMDNAIKYTPEGGSVTVRSYAEDNEIVVEITDTGEGIDEEASKNLFDPYFQGDSSHSRQGLGLGLSIVKRILELCEGEINVTSQPGSGSTFTVKLPLQHTGA